MYFAFKGKGALWTYPQKQFNNSLDAIIADNEDHATMELAKMELNEITK